MSFGGGSSNAKTTSSSSEPWGPTQDYLKQNIKDASNVNSTNIYDGPRVAGQSSQTSGGLAALTGVANQNMGSNGLSGQLQGVINNGGYNSAQMDALNNTRGVANAKFNLESDPAWAQIRDQAISGTNLMSSGMGRTGSGTNQSLLTNNLADAGARQYSAWQARQDAANQNLFNMGQQGFGNLNTAYTGMQAPGSTLLGVGQQQDAYQQSLINSNIDKFDEENNARRNDIAWRQGIYSGAGQLGGTQTNKAATGGQSGLGQILGYGLTAAGTLGGFF